MILEVNRDSFGMMKKKSQNKLSVSQIADYDLVCNVVIRPVVLSWRNPQAHKKTIKLPFLKKFLMFSKRAYYREAKLFVLQVDEAEKSLVPVLVQFQ